jgi:hypothetical protein
MSTVNNIRPIIQGLEQIQKIRIQTGNRIAANFQLRLLNKIATATTDKEKEKLEKEYAKILTDLRKEYILLTNSIVNEEYEIILGNLPTPKKFQPSPLISTYAELILVDQYVRLYNQEKINGEQLEIALNEVPIYTRYLKHVDGVGPKMAGVLISEIDIRKAKYISSLWRLAGLDTTVVGKYTNDKGEKVLIPFAEIMKYYEDIGENGPMFYHGKHEVTFETVGRSRQAHCLVDIPYTNKEGQEAIRRGITFNPYLKTKIVGVLAPAFLKASKTFVNGKRMGVGLRIKLASGMGCEVKGTPAAQKEQADTYLREAGYELTPMPTRFGKIYYDYKSRIERSQKPEHQGKTPSHIHNMSVRYAAKEFLRELYVVWRHLEGLPIYESYETAKLGYSHNLHQEILDEFKIDPRTFVTEAMRTELEGRPVVISDDPYAHYPQALRDYLKLRNQPAAIVTP